MSRAPIAPTFGAGRAESTPCPWRGPRLADELRPTAPPCARPVAGIDEQRTCNACRAAGAPARVDWTYLSGVTPPPPLVLGNAHLITDPAPTSTRIPEEPTDQAGSSE